LPRRVSARYVLHCCVCLTVEVCPTSVVSLHGALRGLLSFPTRRSSDLHGWWDGVQPGLGSERSIDDCLTLKDLHEASLEKVLEGDRKSTRLNSSHGSISYAVFCLKKKNNPSTAPFNAQLPPCTSTHTQR